MAVSGQHLGGGVREVRAGGGTDASVTRRAGHPVLQVRGHLRQIVLQVPTVAQEDVRQPGGDDLLLGEPVLGGEDETGGVRLRDARVADQADPGLPGSGDHVSVLGHPPAHLAAGDEHQLLGAGEGRP
ncbi:hypothetical protein GCM10029963_40290 [Micromonospora andamanensis]